MQRWIWVTHPEFYSQLQPHGRSDDRLWKWTCHEDTRRGDCALLYRTEPAKDIAHAFKVESQTPWLGEHPYVPDAEAYWCEATLVHDLDQPIALQRLRSEPRLHVWPALDLNFRRLAFEIPPDIWRVLLSLADPQDRIALRRCGGT